MPKFKGSKHEVFIVRADIQRVVDTMSDPEVFSQFVDDLETLERVEPDTFRWSLKEISDAGIRFKGDYTTRYERDGNKTVRWKTVKSVNMTSTGEAHFAEMSGGGTRVDYTETIETEIAINRLLGRLVKPIVDRQIARGVSEYLKRVKTHLEG